MRNNKQRRRKALGKSLLVAILLVVLPARASAADQPANVQRLERKLIELEARFVEMERTHQAELSKLRSQIKTLSANGGDAGTTAVAGAPIQTAPLESAPSLAAQSSGPARAGNSYMNVSFGTLMDAGWSTESEPSRELELGDHDPQKRGFSLRNAELALDGAVDPYFKGFANIVLKLDENDETDIELEESYLTTSALPGDLQLKAGQFFANFGRQNSQHPHQWSFVDQPLILTRAFGPEGLRNVGAQLSWLIPTPFYSEVFLGILDGQGGTTFLFRNPGEPDEDGRETVHGRATDVRALRGPGDLVFTPRIASSFDLTDTQTLVTGVSGAFGPNSTGQDSRTQIYGADVYWKWKPETATAGFPFVAFQSEVVYARFEAGEDLSAALPAETLKDYGTYAQVLWGFEPQWIVGFRADSVDGNGAVSDDSDPFRGERYRLSPVLTFLPSEFSKVRLQYNFDHGAHFGDASSIWMQLEFDLGSHAAHKF
ncbi:MAG: hypothetical protein U0136_18695 [Bdellovibrionota bacterium]